MKTTVKLFVALSLVACGGEMGPPGEPGEMGEEGERGRDGEQGEPGADGEDATPYTPITSVHCSEQVGNWLMTYDIVEWSDRSVLVTCSIATQQQESSKTLYFAASQTGRQSLSCILAQDAEQDGTFGWWQFSNDGNGDTTAEYNDTGSADDGSVVTFDDCMVQDLAE